MDTQELARGYTVANDTQVNAGHFLLDRLKITPGMRVLDVGCGPGDLTAHIASLVGDQGSVVGVDPSPERIAIATNRTPRPPNLTFHEGIAEDLSRFPAASFDVVFVNSTLHWVQDQPAALREFARVLKPGRGRVGISGGSGDYLTAQERIKADVLSREPYRRYPEAAPPKFLKRSELEGLLRDAGFGGWDVVVNKIVKTARDADAIIDWLDTSSSGKTYGGIPLQLRPAAREEMREEWSKLAAEDGMIRMEMELLVTVAVRA
ncbi:S-adenosyl-L-methionine-dependent methyltransferase [Chaetomidium leptoderma]|uniref:S-adenosyl-L-methionine-dependent methyltransferase n=1 Tax=Chaetomidium leptoderma TaxID=669021 RepID=A0AAN6VCS5_9PEZI|nr:S-adenosyl-L-methionine-dependent methyltransferase [Chaetomidium leptoderma]